MKVTVEGVLTPLDVEEGQLAGLVLNTTDERELVVDLSGGVGRRLRTLLGKRILLTGRIHTAEIISVTDYEIVDP